jgi:hypothetical protein
MDRPTGTTYGPLYRHNIWTALQAQHMASATEEIFLDIANIPIFAGIFQIVMKL